MGFYVAAKLIFLLNISFFVYAHDAEEPAHYKYSAEANIHSHGHAHEHSHTQRTPQASPSQIWLNTIGSVMLISIAPVIVLFIVPDLNKHQHLLKVLLGFAAGGLLGDAFLHLIPHALSPHSHDEKHGHEHTHSPPHSHENSSIPLWVIGGIFAFLCIEKFLLLFRSAAEGGHGHSHKTPPIQKSVTSVNHLADNQPVSVGDKNKKKKKHNDKSKNVGNDKNAKKSKTDSDDWKKHQPQQQHPQNRHQVGEKNEKKIDAATKKRRNSKFQVAGYLNLAADFTHNFTDGIAIAGSFIIGGNIGFVTTLTVLLHELPHEIGDYAILIQSGCGARKAMLLQLVTALGALLGATLSLIVAGIGVDNKVLGFGSLILSPEFISTRLLPITAGGFIYIALVSVMSDLLKPISDGENATKRSKFRLLLQSLAELCAIVVGVALMALITIFE